MPRAILIALAWLQAPDTCWTRILTRLHWGMLGFLSLLVPVFILAQPLLVSHGVMEEPELADTFWWEASLLAPLLAGLAWAGWKKHAGGQRPTALLLAAAWMLALATFGFIHYPLSHHGRYEGRADCERVARATAGTPLYFLDVPTQKKLMPDEKFLFYIRRVIPGKTANALKERGTATPAFTITDAKPDHAERMATIGWVPVFDFQDGRRLRTLYSSRLLEERIP